MSNIYSSGSQPVGCKLLHSVPGGSEYTDDYIKLNTQIKILQMKN
jgi:hypothetical protein